jgi:SAM-dependent methyltransferase
MAVPLVHEAVVRALQGEPRGRVLDVPSGEGALAAELLAMGHEVTCGDIEPAQFKLDGVVCHHLDLNKDLPFPAEHFDLVTCVEGIEYLENPHHLIREVRRVLKPAGKLILSTPNTLSLKSRMHGLRLGYPIHFDLMVRREQAVGDEWTVKHLNPVSFLELRYILDEYRFQLTDLEVNKLERKHPFFYELLARVVVKNRLQGDSQAEKSVRDLLNSRKLLFGEILIVKAQKVMIERSCEPTPW